MTITTLIFISNLTKLIDCIISFPGLELNRLHRQAGAKQAVFIYISQILSRKQENLSLTQKLDKKGRFAKDSD